ncbi:MAG: O-methyltransferase [Halobacteriales archaeon]|nr:O-methyltransferase [Halobacteriales archaeon]
MTEVFPDPIRRFMAAAGPEPTAIQMEMQAQAESERFPIIGPEVGGFLQTLVGLVDATTVFEFGSGFGYSASWFLRGMPPEGQIVLTEHDPTELEDARAYFDRAGLTDRATFEDGDALAIIEEYDGPFDIALIDHQKERYVDGFEAIRGKIAPGGVVIADNMMRGPLDFEDVLAGIEGESSAEQFDDSTAGVIRYLKHVRSASGFSSTVLPIGSGVALSHKRRDEQREQ